MPGVKDDRYREGLEPQHCALSLVGEPIMYPEINQFIELLHRNRISSFLVTNAQFPEAIRWSCVSCYSSGSIYIASLSNSYLLTELNRWCASCFSFFFDPCAIFVSSNLVPVTQLYVSVDASTKSTLKKIDRPLFRDFWERLLASLEALSSKVSTVPRLSARYENME